MKLNDLLEWVKPSRFTQREIDDSVAAIQSSSEFKAILDTGAKFISSKVQLRRGVLRFKYDEDRSYAVYANGTIRGENLNSKDSRQTKHKLNIQLNYNLSENYQRMLVRLLQIINRRERAQVKKNEIETMLNKKATTLADLDLPSSFPSSLVLDKRYDLMSLKGAPSSVKGKFSLHYCSSLESLEGGPKHVEDFSIVDCAKLTSLVGAPLTCKYFTIQSGMMEDLEGCPKCDGLNFQNMRRLASLRGLQKEFKRGVSIFITHDSPVSLEGAGRDYLTNCANLTIKAKKATHGLGLMFVKFNDVDTIKYVTLDFPGGGIIKKYLNTGHDGLIDCQHELIEAGYEDLAKL